MGELRRKLKWVVLTRDGGGKEEEESAEGLLRQFMPGCQIRRGRKWVFRDLDLLRTPRLFDDERCPCSTKMSW